MFHAILAASDRITARDPVVISAARLASALSVPWSLLHVLESASLRDRQRVLHFRTGKTQEATPSYCADVRRQIRHTYEDLLAWASPTEIHITTGFPWIEISSRADRHAADLVVMGPHTHGADEPKALHVLGRIGSTLEGVITRDHAPAMIINRHPCRPKPAFKRLLVGIDFSAACESAVRFAAAMARFYRAEINLFHMLPVAPFPKYTRQDYETDLAQIHTRMEAFGHRYLGDIAHAYHFWGGALPYREIFKCAERCKPDAIILGSHTTETQGKWYAGSTVEKVSLQAVCPVFVITDFKVRPAREASGVLEEQTAPCGDSTLAPR